MLCLTHRKSWVCSPALHKLGLEVWHLKFQQDRDRGRKVKSSRPSSATQGFLRLAWAIWQTPCLKKQKNVKIIVILWVRAKTEIKGFPEPDLDCSTGENAPSPGWIISKEDNNGTMSLHPVLGLLLTIRVALHKGQKAKGLVPLATDYPRLSSFSCPFLWRLSLETLFHSKHELCSTAVKNSYVTLMNSQANVLWKLEEALVQSSKPGESNQNTAFMVGFQNSQVAFSDRHEKKSLY